MNALQSEDLYEAGLLLRYGLRPKERSSSGEYAHLLARFQNEPFFQDAVENIARGLGLMVVDVSELGLILVPVGDSPFAPRGKDLPGETKTKDERLLYGLIYIAIFAAVFPQGADLAENPRYVRSSVTIEAVEKSLRSLCDSLATEAQRSGNLDVTVDEQQNDLYGAWRVFHARQSAAESADGGKQQKTTTTMIKRALEYLAEQGCFMLSKNAFVPTYRFVMLVRQWGADPLYKTIQEALSRSTATPPPPRQEAL